MEEALGSYEKLTMIELIRSDICRYIGKEPKKLIKIIKTFYEEEALLYLVCYRINHRINDIEKILIKIILKILFSWTVFKLLSLILGIKIDSKAEIGEGFYISHFGQIFVGPIKIGKNCNISQGVTIGYGGIGTGNEGLPEIGNNVFIGPGAMLFGKIIIGNEASIGANCLVTKNIPDNATVIGNPGRIIGFFKKNLQIQNEWKKI